MPGLKLTKYGSRKAGENLLLYLEVVRKSDKIMVMNEMAGGSR